MKDKDKRAVLVSVYKDGGDIHLRLNDVTHESERSKMWKQDVIITSIPITEEKLDKLEFSDKELANFGYGIIARLRAFLKMGEL